MKYFYKSNYVTLGSDENTLRDWRQTDKRITFPLVIEDRRTRTLSTFKSSLRSRLLK